jgi:glycerol-3-phosphate acyltransferase PlsY
MVESIEHALILFAIATLVISYLIGSIPLTWLLVKIFKGKDLHEHGSGNVGASNVFATTKSLPLTIIGGLFDLTKGYLCMWIASLLGLPVYLQVLAGLGAILGHNYSIFLKFSGGRGVLTTVGVLFYFSPWVAVGAVVLALAFVPFHQLALGTIIAALSAVLVIFIFPGLFNYDNDMAFWYGIGTVLIFIIMITRRLLAKRTALSKDEPLWRVLLCRMLFDRDIPNREAWITQDRTKQVT